jgi:predicted RNA polymerase sigma factor
MTAAEQVERIFREEHGRVLAALISQFEDFDLAENALQDALVNALERWQGDGIPENPGAWLTTVARRMTYFSDMKDIKAKKAELVEVLKQLVKLNT